MIIFIKFKIYNLFNELKKKLLSRVRGDTDNKKKGKNRKPYHTRIIFEEEYSY